MKIIGIDPSKRSTGICIYDPDTGEYETAVIKSKSGQKELLVNYPEILKGLVDWSGSKVLIEGYPFGLKSAYIFDRAELVGVIKYHVQIWGGCYESVNPSQWKSEVIGKGWRKIKKRTKAEEEAYCKTISLITGVEVSNNDEADALGIVYWYLSRRKFYG